MDIQFQHIEPHYLLKEYISKMWLFKSSGRMARDDLKLVVPNGNVKLTLSYQNGIVAAVEGKTYSSKEHDITLTGLIDVPVILDVEQDVATETIGIEFNPRGAYRFFHFNLHGIQNRIHSLGDIWGSNGTRLVEKINEAPSAREKIALLQQFLLRQLLRMDRDLIFEYCIEKISLSEGSVSVRELEKKTGYSSRWLNLKFQEKLGVSPKNLSSIIRFSQYYHSLIASKDKSFSKNDFYRYYYDQSHFIRDFKRFTGMSPGKLEKQVNDFGKTYYVE